MLLTPFAQVDCQTYVKYFSVKGCNHIASAAVRNILRLTQMKFQFFRGQRFKLIDLQSSISFLDPDLNNALAIS